MATMNLTSIFPSLDHVLEPVAPGMTISDKARNAVGGLLSSFLVTLAGSALKELVDKETKAKRSKKNEQQQADSVAGGTPAEGDVGQAAGSGVRDEKKVKAEADAKNKQMPEQKISSQSESLGNDTGGGASNTAPVSESETVAPDDSKNAVLSENEVAEQKLTETTDAKNTLDDAKAECDTSRNEESKVEVQNEKKQSESNTDQKNQPGAEAQPRPESPLAPESEEAVARRKARKGMEVVPGELSCSDFLAAINKILPGELCKHAVSEVNAAVAKLTDSVINARDVGFESDERIVIGISGPPGRGRAAAKSVLDKIVNRVPLVPKNAAGLCLPTRVIGLEIARNTGRALSPCGVASATAAVEYVSAEILELAGREAKESSQTEIMTAHVHHAIRHDDELDAVFARPKF